MLDEVFIRRITNLAMAAYAANNDGKKGIAKRDVIEAVMAYNGDMDDVNAVMLEGAKLISPEMCTRLFL